MHYIIVNPQRYFNPRLPQKELFYKNLIECFDQCNIPYSVVKTEPLVKYPNKVITFHTKDPDNFNVKISHIPDWFYFDRKGYNGWSEYGTKSPNLQAVLNSYARQRFSNIQKYVISDNLTKIYQSDENLPDYGDFLFMALQSINDSVSQLMRTSWFELIKNIKKIPYKVVIKRHPHCRASGIKQLLNDAVDNKKVFLSTASIHKLIPASRGVITGNSGVEFEALLYLKPVFVYAHSDYKWVCYQDIEFKDIPKRLSLFDNEQKLLIKKFVVDFLDNYLINVYNKESYARRFKQVGILPL